MTTLQPLKGSLERQSPTTRTAAEDPRVVCPIRTSTDHQDYGLEAQREALLEHGTRHRLDILGIFPDQISAKEHDFLKRPSVVKMLAYMRDHDIRRILVTKVDRAFRSTADFLLTCAWLQEKGYVIQVADLGLDSSTPHGRMVIGILAQLGEWELAMRSERQLAAFRTMRNEQRPCAGTIRYGWQPDPSRTGHLMPDWEQQSILCEIIIMHDEGRGQTPEQIAEILNARGTPKTYRRKRRDQTGQTYFEHLRAQAGWTKPGVTSIIEHAQLADPPSA